jgi:3-deoxy-D-manno-octulosonate 8-phosphate phosphatase (KDO 8-P phosphatase)
MNKLAFVIDVDGTLTDGKMVYSKDGKMYKSFGCDDWNALQVLGNYLTLKFISADRKGFPITLRRIEEECGYDLTLVSGEGHERWAYITKRFPRAEGWNVIFMGDGICDRYPLERAYYGITTIDALPPVQRAANYVTDRPGGNRAVAEACLHIAEKFGLTEELGRL